MPKPTETINQTTLAELAGVDASLLRRARADLPPPSTTVPSAGRPTPLYDLDDIAAYAFSRTSHLSDVECRLRCAVSAKCRKPHSPDGEQQS